MPASAAPGELSVTTTSSPARTATSAMPDPINPHPTTPTRSITRDMLLSPSRESCQTPPAPTAPMVAQKEPGVRKSRPRALLGRGFGTRSTQIAPMQLVQRDGDLGGLHGGPQLATDGHT